MHISPMKAKDYFGSTLIAPRPWELRSFFSQSVCMNVYTYKNIHSYDVCTCHTHVCVVIICLVYKTHHYVRVKTCFLENISAHSSPSIFAHSSGSSYRAAPSYLAAAASLLFPSHWPRCGFPHLHSARKFDLFLSVPL